MLLKWRISIKQPRFLKKRISFPIIDKIYFSLNKIQIIGKWLSLLLLITVYSIHYILFLYQMAIKGINIPEYMQEKA